MHNVIRSIVLVLSLIALGCGSSAPGSAASRDALNPGTAVVSASFASTAGTAGWNSPARPIYTFTAPDGAGFYFQYGFAFVPGYPNASFDATHYLYLQAWDCPAGSTDADGDLLVPDDLFADCTSMAHWNGASQSTVSGEPTWYTADVDFTDGYTTQAGGVVVLQAVKNAGCQTMCTSTYTPTADAFGG